jgi:hypothetical protein
MFLNNQFLYTSAWNQRDGRPENTVLLTSGALGGESRHRLTLRRGPESRALFSLDTTPFISVRATEQRTCTRKYQKQPKPRLGTCVTHKEFLVIFGSRRAHHWTRSGFIPYIDAVFIQKFLYLPLTILWMCRPITSP